jgi:hypothetical protein
MTSSAAATIASASRRSSRPASALVAPAAFLTRAYAWMTATGMRSSPIAKWMSERCVWAPQ